MVDVSFTMIVQWINFGLLLFLLYILLYKPLMDFLDKRGKKIASNIEEALNNKEESLKMLEDYKSKMRDIQVEADKVFDAVRKKAEEEKHTIMESAHAESRQIIDSAKAEIKREAAKAQTELKAHVSSLIISCSEKVLEREINESDHKKFIEDFLNT
jgi:F-type H+-transporting ATPase subunit b